MTTFSEWRIWNGGECPVDPDVRVQFQRAGETRLEAQSKNLWEARDAMWEYGDTPHATRIIAYREVIEPVVGEKKYRYGVSGPYWGHAPIISSSNFGDGFTPFTADVTVVDGEITRILLEREQ